MSADKPDGTRTHETDFAALWSSDGVTRSLSGAGASLPADLPFLFSAGQRFGAYLVVRPLGKGGMGQVYEAEEIESGRRVAIKLLSRGLGDDEERERFLREGQLAASLSHPNCVYVFGTSEVQGFPVIAMELAPAGTLKDLVNPAAPMTVAAAVDAILQVIAGLDAAAAIGILHRDVKPSNCFVDRDGRVMVGDFGLSISTAGDAGAGRGVVGTPGFASPEQLNGAALDVRSDIYSVGATLYYLLTGTTPFDTADLKTMMTRVTSETAPVITATRPDIPGRVGSIVAKCLATKPADRHANYAALAAALEPFRTVAIVPAPLGRRFLAGFIDSYAASLPLMPLNLVMGQRLQAAERQGELVMLVVPSIAASIVYYTLLEGRFGCAAGKAALNLRVVDELQHAPGFKRALVRAFAFIVPAQIFVQGVTYALLRAGTAAFDGASAGPVAGLLVIPLTFVTLAALFLPARRRNGYAAFHDRASRTRVVVRRRAIEACDSARGSTAGVDPAAFGTARIGPYLVPDAAIQAARQATAATVVEGYDDRLRRAVWIELLPPGTPPVPAWRRDLNRPGRARWITGRRSGEERWDAYERLDGEPLSSAIRSPQPWSRVRHWVADAAREIAAASRDGSLPVLRHDRVWISRDSRARLLDLTPPAASAGCPTSEPDPQRFLYGLAVGSLTGTAPDVAAARPTGTPLPGGARALLLALRSGTAGHPDAVAARSVALLREAAVLPRRRRLLQLAVCAIIPVTMTVAAFTAIKLQLRARTADPAAYVLKACVNRLSAFEKKGESRLNASEREQRELIELYIAERLREPAEETASYAKSFPLTARFRTDYGIAERALGSRHPSSPARLARAEAVVSQVVTTESASLENLNRPVILTAAMGFIAGASLLAAAALGLLGAIAARGGFTLRAFGAMLVTADGSPVSRLRALARALVAWSPLAVWMLVVKLTPPVQQATAMAAVLYAIVMAIVVLGALWAWRHPSRGIQDWIAGTWIVPREQKTAA